MFPMKLQPLSEPLSCAINAQLLCGVKPGEKCLSWAEVPWVPCTLKLQKRMAHRK